MEAYVLFSCEVGMEDNVSKDLYKIKEVKSCDITFGAYDVVSKIETKNEKDFIRVMTEKIPKIENIRSTITLKSYRNG